jgi:hypothetical protein
LSRISSSGFAAVEDATGQVTGIAFTLNDIADTGSRGGDEIEGIDLLEATGNQPVASGSQTYLA